MSAIWKFTDATRRIVARQRDDGAMESCLIVAIAEWLAAGNAVLEPDPAPPPTQDELDAAAARAYAKLVTLAGMSPAEIQAWTAANVTNASQFQDAITTLAIAVSVLFRRAL